MKYYAENSFRFFDLSITKKLQYFEFFLNDKPVVFLSLKHLTPENIEVKTANEIQLLPEFSVDASAEFQSFLGDCPEN